MTSLFPAGTQRGKTVVVTAGGSFDSWPVQVWVDGKGVEAKAAKDKGKLSVAAAGDAVPGVYWLRLFNEQGASALRPFVVGTLAEVLEQEPNDDPKKPQVLASTTVTVNGRLEKTGDVDGFAVKLRKGQPLVASMEANRVLGSPLDAILQVVSAGGFVLDQNNDYHDLDPQIVFVAPAEDTYLVRTFAFPAVADSAIRFAGGAEFIYRLTLTTGGFVDHAYPLAVARSNPGQVELRGWNLPDSAQKLAVGPGDGSDTSTLFHPQLANTTSVRLEPHPTATEAEPNDLKQPQGIQLPVTISGRIDPAGDEDVYRFLAKKGQKLLFRVEARSLGYPLDPVLRLTDAAGKTLAQVDDTGAGSRDAELAFTAAQDGPYHIAVRDLHGHGGFRYVYRLRAVFPEPDFALTLAADRFTLLPGKPLDIPVAIDRRNGFNGAIEISAGGLPAGVTASPVSSTPTGSAAKSVTLRVSTTTDPLSAPFFIIGKAQGQPDLSRTARSALPGLNASTPRIWLTILKPGSAAPKPAQDKK